MPYLTVLRKISIALVGPAGLEPATSWFVVVAVANALRIGICSQVLFQCGQSRSDAFGKSPFGTGCYCGGAQIWAQRNAALDR